MKQVYLQTYGCQMNERDSEEILGMLTAQGYTVVQREEEADVILLNTCSVRRHAEERAFGKMAALCSRRRSRRLRTGFRSATVSTWVRSKR